MQELIIIFYNNGFEKYPYEHAFYMQATINGDMSMCVFMLINLIFTSNNLTLLNKLKKCMTQKFKMMDISLMGHFLDIEVVQIKDKIFIFIMTMQKGFLRDLEWNLVIWLTPHLNILELRKSFSSGNVDQLESSKMLLVQTGYFLSC